MNIMEQLVWEHLDSVLDVNPEVCKCTKCRADIVAFALNQLQPHYVVSSKGKVLSKVGHFNLDSKSKLLVALANAAKTVADSPRHDYI